MDISQIIWNAFMDDLGTDWVAIDATGHPVCRASDKASAERAMPNAALYVTGADLPKRKLEDMHIGELMREVEKFDHDKNGKPGGSPAGTDSTATKGKAKKAAAEAPKPKVTAPAAKKAPKVKK